MRSAIDGPSSRIRRSRARPATSTATIASPTHTVRRARPRLPRRVVERRARRARRERQGRAQARFPPGGRSDLHHPLEDGSSRARGRCRTSRASGAPRAPAPHRARAGAARRPRALGSPSARRPASKLSIPLEKEAGSASPRLIEAPKRRLKIAQRKIARVIVDQVRPTKPRTASARDALLIDAGQHAGPHRAPHGPRRILPFDHRGRVIALFLNDWLSASTSRESSRRSRRTRHPPTSCATLALEIERRVEASAPPQTPSPAGRTDLPVDREPLRAPPRSPPRRSR